MRIRNVIAALTVLAAGLPAAAGAQTIINAGFETGAPGVYNTYSDLVAEGTVVTFERDGVMRQATWSQERRRWITPDGRPLMRSDPSDPVLHDYRNGHMVGTAVGFVSTSRTGRVFANVGVPVDSPGDRDAFVRVQERTGAVDVDEARRLLSAR